MYAELLQFDLTYPQLYDMTFGELNETLENRRKGLGYEMWRQASLNRYIMDKHFPRTAEKAVPELFPHKGIKMPDFLKNDVAKKLGG